VAETFLTAWRKIDDVPDGDRAVLWLYRVAHRTVGRQWRTRDRRRRLTSRLAMVRGETSEPEDRAIDNDDLRRVLAAKNRLNHTDAEVLLLQCWEGLSRNEIADVLELDPNAVSQRLHRARRNLAKEFSRLERRAFDRTTPVARKGGTP
jgi:RNA polymerase sigma-70 factor (ECF subfamily)